jgi:uncharacterized protein YfeS
LSENLSFLLENDRKSACEFVLSWFDFAQKRALGFHLEGIAPSIPRPTTCTCIPSRAPGTFIPPNPGVARWPVAMSLAALAFTARSCKVGLMEFHVMSRSYNTYGGHPTLSLIPDFLLGGGAEFGAAISELTVTFHFAHSGPPGSTLEKMFETFHTHRLSLPKVAFRRSRGQAEIDIASNLFDAKDWDRTRGLSLPLFQGAVSEIVAAVALLKQRLTAKDDFDLDRFVAHCAKAQQRVPSSEPEFTVLADEIKQRDLLRRAAMSPWEKLGIDWRDYHPDARQILDDPFYWDCGDDFAPHGNDTGADLLGDYRSWLRRNPGGDTMLFYRQQSREWFEPNGSLSEVMLEVPDEAAVALAFAELKLRADCRPAVAALARAAIQRQRERAIAATGWSHRETRLESLKLLESKLPSGGTPGR